MTPTLTPIVYGFDHLPAAESIVKIWKFKKNEKCRKIKMYPLGFIGWTWVKQDLANLLCNNII